MKTYDEFDDFHYENIEEFKKFYKKLGIDKDFVYRSTPKDKINKFYEMIRNVKRPSKSD